MSIDNILRLVCKFLFCRVNFALISVALTLYNSYTGIYLYCKNV